MPADGVRQLCRRALEPVVLDHVVELAGLLELLPRELDSLPYLACALRVPLPQAPLELLDACGDEDRHRARNLAFDAQGALRLELEQGHVALRRDPLELGAEGPGAVAGDVLDVLEELAAPDAGEELVVGEEPVLAAVLLCAPPLARRGRDRH